jgi:hypothetical protein
MSDETTARDEPRRVNVSDRAPSSFVPSTRSGRTSGQASNMRIRTVPGPAVAPNSASSSRRRKQAVEDQPADTRVVPIEPPERRQGTESTPSTSDLTRSKKRSRRHMRRSRRWVQLRSTTPRNFDTVAANTTPGDVTYDNDVEPARYHCAASSPSPDWRETEFTQLYEDSRKSPVEAGRQHGVVRHADPFPLLFELAMLPSRMTLIATTEALKLLIPNRDGCHPRLMTGMRPEPVGQARQHD